ncbi:MAG: hypothetical protein E7430_07145 [Ruminococcaceae bacterium]|nr:hypothetical protein [Oscillospiraceae bacterium]
MKRILCFFLIVLLIAAVCVPALAADIWFIAVDDSIPVTLTGGAVPFYYNNQLYVPYSAFDSDVLNVFSIYDSSQNVLAMYNIDHRLTFDISAGTVTDFNGNTESTAALSRSGSVYVPVFYVSSYFSLGCSLLEGSGGYPIIRLTSGNEVYDNDKFITQSKTLVEYRVSQYLSEPSPTPSVEPSPSPDVSPSPEVSSPVTESPDHHEPPPDAPPESDPITVPDVALFLPGGSFKTVAASLGNTPAVFTYDADSLYGSDNTVRAIICAGYPIAMELDLTDVGHALETAARFNELLDGMTNSKTMLVVAKNATDEAVDALSQYGFKVWSNTVNAVGDFKITDYEGSVSVFMPSPKSTGVSYLVKFVRYYGGDFIDIKLTTEPF